MNIQEAKTEICNTLRAYLAKDENGYYTYPLIRQRPLLLIGPPGIGKTAIMEQAAAECGVGLVAYTITHHTRQSAIGLPEIVKRNYGGKGMMVTDYTMSEIVASVYDCMENTGRKEGILFIDEINCVSETLIPTMLQFLQCKTFGNQKVPEGWVIVAAGNEGPEARSVTTPGISRKVITVGCSDDDREVLVGGNRMVDYSGRGPTAACICKPDLVAPGCSVVSCSSRADKYTIKSGTSMSTPIVSGAVALLLERFPDMSNKDVKLRLRESSVDIGLPRNQQGWGLLDVGKMLER